MALFGKDRERNERPRVAGYETVEPTADTGAPAADRAWIAGEPATATPAKAFLGKGSRIDGKLSFEGPAHIDGHVDGEIVAQDTLTIGEGAIVNAQIVGGSIVIHGKVTGNVTARKRLEIRAPGTLIGNIATPSLVIHDGVVFEGECSMGTADAQRDRKLSVVGRDAADGAQRRLSEAVK